MGVTYSVNYNENVNNRTRATANNPEEVNVYSSDFSNETREELLNAIYTQNDSLLFNRNDSHPNNQKVVIKNSKSKSAKSFQNPFMVNKSSIKFEKDATKGNIFYITFKYISLIEFELNVYLNGSKLNKADENTGNTENPNANFTSLKFPSPYYSNNNIQKSLTDLLFFDKNLNIDLENYINEKNSDPNFFDLIFELKTNKENNQEECILGVFCNFINSKKENQSSLNFSDFTIKVEKTKLKIKNNWYEIHGVYGYDTKNVENSNECEACCINKKNTIFLPCKHSYACSECSMVVRLPVNRCPLCRQVITDCIIMEK